jgi:hypothetical protein
MGASQQSTGRVARIRLMRIRPAAGSNLDQMARFSAVQNRAVVEARISREKWVSG